MNDRRRTTSASLAARLRIGVVTAAATALLGATAAVPLQASAATADLLQFNDNGDEHVVVGPNSVIRIDHGAVRFLPSCRTLKAGKDPVNDFAFPISDVYLVKAGTETEWGNLEDVGGMPNTILGLGVTGAFIQELIGVTKPAGKLDAGTYDIVYDNCQDGIYDSSNDTIWPNAVQVDLPAVLPPISPSLQGMKQPASDEADRLRDFAKYWAKRVGGEAYAKCFDAPDAALLGECALGTWLSKNGSRFASDLQGPLAGAANAMIAQYNHYLAIANDPPDPDFAHPTTVKPVAPASPLDTDPALAALDRFTAASAAESATAEAFLHAIERYQGAAAAHDAHWALAQSRQAVDLAATLRAQAQQSAAALAALDAPLAATTNLDAATASAAQLAGDVARSGFNGEQRRALRNLGMSDADVVEAERYLISQAGEPVTTAQLLDGLHALKTSYDGVIAALGTTAAGLQTIVDDLTAQTAVPQDLPVAEAGGPYTATAGTSLTLDGSKSTANVSYAWDTDGDGQFDDATGAHPTVTVDAGHTAPIGLQVTDASNRTAVSYAPVSVTDGNALPQITSAAPAAAALHVTVGQAVGFAVSATDADGVEVHWSIDGTAAGAGTAFSYTATAAGVHQVRAVVGDGRPGHAVTRTWLLTATTGDGDGDGWTSASDCDDSNAQVHPARTELFGNGVDDDCDPATPDVPVGGVPSKAVSWGWGSTALSQLTPFGGGTLDNVVQVAGGYRAAALVDDQGHVATWSTPLVTSFSGDGTYQAYDKPHRVASVGATTADADHQLTGVTQVSVNDTTYVARRADGTVVAWGQNGSGQVGDGTLVDRLVPVVVKGVGGVGNLSGVRSVWTSGDVSFALLNDGTAVGWGQRGRMCLGNDAGSSGPQPTPMPLPLWGNHIKKLVSASGGVVALYDDGSVKACGSTSEGIYGRAGAQWPSHTYPNPVDGLSSGVVDIDLTLNAMALKSDGTLWIWGRNYSGQAGIGVTDQDIIVTPRQVPIPAGAPIVSINAGFDTDVVVRADGSALTWGNNPGGVAATGSSAGTLTLPTPLIVPAGKALTSVAGGAIHVALMKDAADPPPPAPVRTVSVGDVSVGETAGSVQVPVTLSAPRLFEDTTVHLTTVPGTATEADFTPVSTDVTIPAGQTTATVTVPVLDDAIVEGPESLGVLVTSASGGVTSTDAVGTVTITDDDVAGSAGPAASVSIADRVEGNDDSTVTTATFSLDAPSPRPVTLTYATADGTAGPADYTPVHGSLTIQPGTTTATVPVHITGDGVPEADETFDMRITSAVNATIATARATATVQDDDAYSLVATPAAAAEGAGHVDVKLAVVPTPQPGTTVTVAAATADGTATAGADYTSVTSTLTFDAAHATQTVVVPILDDVIDEPVETLTLHLTGADAGRHPVLVGTPVVQVGIVDDDEPVKVPDATALAYTGSTTVQYSDPLLLKARLTGPAGAPVVGETVALGLGAAAQSAAVTDADGTAAATTAPVTAAAGSLTATAAYAGSAAFTPSSATQAITVVPEDCALAYGGDTATAAGAATTLAAVLSDTDSSPGNRSGKAVTFVVTDAAGASRSLSATTDATGRAAGVMSLPGGAYTVQSAWAGDGYYAPCAAAPAVLTVADGTAKATGGGWVMTGSVRTSIGFNVMTGPRGQLQLTTHGDHDTFHAGVVTSLSGTKTTATWSGTGAWNGVAGYRYDAAVVDGGKADTVSVTIRNPAGAVVFTTGTQPLRGGNITVH